MLAVVFFLFSLVFFYFSRIARSTIEAAPGEMDNDMAHAQHVTLPRTAVASFCKKHGIRRLSLFGSVLRNDFNPARSDVDVLVEFAPGRVPGFITFAGMEQELSRIVGRRVDLHTPASLSRYFRDDVVAGAEVVYDRG